MKTVRLDPALETQVEEAARIEGISVSAFIRRALEKECATSSARIARHRLAPYIGAVCSEEPTDSSRVKDDYRNSIEAKAARWKAR